MKSDLKERRNKAICKRVQELYCTGKPMMDIYMQVGEEFWLEENTICHIVTQSGIYKQKL